MYKVILRSQLLVIALLIASLSFAQEMQEFKLSKSSGKIHIEGINGLEIEGYSGNEIIISTKSKSKEQSERAAGLSAINALGVKDNTGLGIAITTEGDEIKISTVKKNSGKFWMKVPQNMAISFKHSSHSMGKLYIHGMKGEIETSLQYGSVQVERVTGPLSINTVYGKIEAVLTNLNTQNPSSLYSVYGLVDVSLPSSTKTDVHLTSQYGDMFTDFDIKVEANSKISSSRVQGKINGGGPELRINSTYQSVYLRKG
ncbi:MAG: DUF4097 family beta strand repeat-containing protein [Bacteroidota bacterium]